MSETNPLPVDYYERTFSTEPPKPVGLFLSQVEHAPAPHRCGACMNPHTRSQGREDCPGNKAVKRAV